MRLSRRDFLKKSVAGAIGVAAAGVVGIPAMAEEEKEALYIPGTYSATAKGYESDVGRMGQEGIITNDRLQPVIPSTGKPIEGVYLAGVIVGGRHANCYMTPMGGMNHGFDVTFGKCAAEFLTEDNQ